MLHILCKRVLRVHMLITILIIIVGYYFCRLMCCMYNRMYRCMRRLGSCFTGSPAMPMVLPEIFKESPVSDFDRFLTHLDLCLKNQKSNTVDILMILLDERSRSILRTHEGDPGLNDDQYYIYLKVVFYKRSIPDA